jgi:hypothetical protein
MKNKKNTVVKHCHDLRAFDYACNPETGQVGLKCENCKYYH